MRQRSLLALAAAFGIAAFGAHTLAFAQKTKGKTRAAETKYLMRAAVKTSHGASGELLKEAGPRDDAQWDQLACHASILNELGYALMDDGRCPDKTWEEASKILQAESRRLLEAAKAKQLADAQNTLKTLTTSCATCHKAHRYPKPAK